MPVKLSLRISWPSGLAVFAALIGAALLADAMPAFAQGGPFGSTPGTASSSGFTQWILAEQAQFYRALSSAVSASKTDGKAAFGLAWLSFLYGIFHAAGPGHGKAVISSYLVADDATMKRGIVLSFAAALAQAISAVTLVGIAALVLGATAKAMNDTVRYLELGAYGVIVLFGISLAWRKGRAFFAALSNRREEHHVEHHHDHHHHDHGHHDHGHGHDHVRDEHCGHSHGPEPSELKGKGWLKRGLTAVIAVGLRPCSGAILVLVFALSQGIFAIGVAATFAMAFGTAITVTAIALLAVWGKGIAIWLTKRPAGGATTLIYGLETAAALAIVAFGALLFTGQMASERLFPGG
ncbi:MAG TPA: nickel/cobalt transporter [Xanthobacteraceae bacterium]|nr:nickel/cobalt transporter [Xanthobacteraceae bacterium]